MRSSEFYGNNVYILGAGFSFAAGMPLLKDFMTRMRDVRELSDELPKEAQAAIDIVLEERAALSDVRDKVKLNLDNVEDLFSVIEARASTVSTKRAADLRTAIRRAISATLIYSPHSAPSIDCQVAQNMAGHVRQIIPGEGIGHQNGTSNMVPLNPYDLFAALIAHRLDTKTDIDGYKDTVISFNYDLVLEEALNRFHIKPSYGLRGEDYEAQTSPSTDAPLLIKVHGSVNWRSTGRGGVSVVIDPKELLVVDGMRPMLLPPTWSKSTQTKLARDSWADAVGALERAHRIVLIGYSMPSGDAYFKYMLAAGLRRNSALRQFTVVDPSEGIKEAVDNVLDDTYFKNRRKFPQQGLQNTFESFLHYNGTIRQHLGRGRGLNEPVS